MRTAALLALALAFTPLAWAALPATGTTGVGAADTGYTPPVVVLANGASVAWQSTDHGHMNVETAAGGSECFTVSSETGVLSEPVRFDLADGILTATSYGETYTCASALVTPTSAVLLYHCLLHPVMRGSIVVTK